MSLNFFATITAVITIVAVFFILDADPVLYFLPNPPFTPYLQGNVVWITGASSGIGASLAEDVSKAGATVVLSARRVDQLEEVARRCRGLGGGGEVFVLPLDVLDVEGQRKAVEKVMQKFGRVDVLVLNAGRSQRNAAVDTPVSVTEEILRLNFLSYVSLTTLVLPSMLTRGVGHIAVMSSLSGIIGTPVASSYSASKFALHGYYNALRTEVSSRGIDVTLLCPGPVESEIGKHYHANPSLPKVEEKQKKMDTSRCTSLVTKSLYYRLSETWISQQPFLTFTYVAAYLPPVYRFVFNNLVGPMRVKALQVGGDVFDVKAILGLSSTESKK